MMTILKAQEFNGAMLVTAEDCQAALAAVAKALADRKPLMLTDEEIWALQKDEEIGELLKRHIGAGLSYFARKVIAAHIKKQSAPEVVPFDFATWQQGGWIALNADGIKQYHLYSNTKYTFMAREST